MHAMGKIKPKITQRLCMHPIIIISGVFSGLGIVGGWNWLTPIETLLVSLCNNNNNSGSKQNECGWPRKSANDWHAPANIHTKSQHTQQRI